jgi:hypothetical protein
MGNLVFYFILALIFAAFGFSGFAAAVAFFLGGIIILGGIVRLLLSLTN